jgi:hypothetical protein
MFIIMFHLKNCCMHKEVIHSIGVGLEVALGLMTLSLLDTAYAESLNFHCSPNEQSVWS